MKSQVTLKKANLEKMSRMNSNSQRSLKSSTKSVPTVSKKSQIDAQQTLIKIYEKLFAQAQSLIQKALGTDSQSDIFRSEDSLVKIETLMNKLSDQLVVPNSCKNQAAIGKFCDQLTEVAEEMNKVDHSEITEIREINKMLRGVIEKYCVI